MVLKNFLHKLLIILICSALILSCKSNGQNNYSSEFSVQQLEHINKEKIDRGKLFDRGYILEIKELKRIKLDTSQEGFISSLRDIKLYHNNFYAVDGMSPEVIVYELNGDYKKKIKINPPPKKGCYYSNLLQTSRKTFLLKNARHSEIIEFDSLGNVQKKYVENDKNVELAPMDLDYIETKDGLEVYSEIFQWFDDPVKDALTKTLLVGKFNENGELADMFINHDPSYAKYNLINFQPSFFEICNNKLFIIEQALPFIRVFSLNGELLHRFGTPGLHMKPVEKQQKGRMGREEIFKFFSKHTFYSDIRIIDKVKGYNNPVISITYYNPVYKDYGEKEPSCYLILYSVEGELLYNDIEIPNAVKQITENSQLLLVLDRSPDNLVIGLFELILIKQG